jgi:hypothetical protein
MGPRGAGQSLADWLVFVHHGRRMVDLHGKSKQDDIADPLGGNLRDYRAARRRSPAWWPSCPAWPVRAGPDQ